eukprot:SAG11_NODE_251_length_11596_cov_5.592763_6_plen_75_part_00
MSDVTILQAVAKLLSFRSMQQKILMGLLFARNQEHLQRLIFPSELHLSSTALPSARTLGMPSDSAGVRVDGLCS